LNCTSGLFNSKLFQKKNGARPVQTKEKRTRKRRSGIKTIRPEKKLANLPL